MALIDTIEFLGAAVEDGLIGRDAAAELLVEASNGGLKTRGALDYLDNHRTARAFLGGLFADTKALLAALDEVKRAATPEEEAAARLRLDAEMALQQETSRRRERERARRLLADDA